MKFSIYSVFGNWFGFYFGTVGFSWFPPSRNRTDRKKQSLNYSPSELVDPCGLRTRLRPTYPVRPHLSLLASLSRIAQSRTYEGTSAPNPHLTLATATVRAIGLGRDRHGGRQGGVWQASVGRWATVSNPGKEPENGESVRLLLKLN